MDGVKAKAMAMSPEGKARLLFAALVAAAGIGTLIWWVSTEAEYATYEIVTHDPVSGLIADAPVEFHGVDAGHVARVELVDVRTVRVTMSIRRGTPINRATVATVTSRGVATRGFTGYVYVALEQGPGDTGPLVAAAGERYPRITALPAQSDVMDQAIARVERNVQDLTALIKGALDQQMLAEIRESVASVDRVTKTLQAALDSRSVNSLKHTVEDMQVVARTLAENNDRLVKLLQNGEDASRKIQPLLDSSRDTVKALQEQVLPEAQRTLARMDRLTGTLEGLAAKVERDPSVMLKGATPPKPGPGEAK
jgi:phospholipid/cholesterol/gamma-HCH transport system substrate-binding protein